MWLHDTVNIVCSLDIMWLRDAVVMSARSWPTHHWVLSSSVIRASHYCMEGRGFKFHLELRIFFCVFLSTHIIFSFIIIKCVTKVVCSTSILKFSSFKNNKSKNSAKYHKILMSRFEKSLYLYHCFFRCHVCLSYLKHAPSCELPLTAAKLCSATLNNCKLSVTHC